MNRVAASGHDHHLGLRKLVAPSPRRSGGTCDRARRPPASSAQPAHPAVPTATAAHPCPGRAGRAPGPPACCAGGRRATAAATSGGWSASTGVRAQELANASIVERSSSSASRSSAARRCARSAGSAIPGLAPISTRRSIRGRAPERDVQRDPPAHRVADQRERSRRRAADDVGDHGFRSTGWRSEALAVAADVGSRTRARAGTVAPSASMTASQLDAGVREAVQEDARGSLICSHLALYYRAISNPFRYSSPVEPEDMIDREHERGAGAGAGRRSAQRAPGRSAPLRQDLVAARAGPARRQRRADPGVRELLRSRSLRPTSPSGSSSRYAEQLRGPLARWFDGVRGRRSGSARDPSRPASSSPTHARSSRCSSAWPCPGGCSPSTAGAA